MTRESMEQSEARRALYEEYKTSGEGLTGFSRARDIPYSKLRRVVEKSRKESGEEVFREVTPRRSAAVSVSEYRVTLSNGRELTLPEHFNGTVVRELVELLERC